MYKRKKGISFYIFIMTFILFIVIISIILIYNIRIFKINGSSMTPTLYANEYILSYSQEEYKQGDIIAFYHDKVVMIKRIIATSNDVVNIIEDGTVFINDVELEENYISEKSLGEPEIEFPYTVPENSYFVLGDNRQDSIDSRNFAIGCITEDDIVGIVKISIWEPKKIN